MQLSFDAADRLVELVQARRGAVSPEEAARVLFALERAPATLAHSLLADVVDGDARLAWLGGARRSRGRRAAPRSSSRTPSSSSSTSRRRGSRRAAIACARSARCGCRRSRSRRPSRRSSSPGVALPPTIARLTGIRDAELRRAPRPELAVRRFLGFAGDAPLAAHNARFDVGFLDRAVERLTGRRVAAPVVDTVWLARRLLQRRSERFSLEPARALLRHVVRAVPPGACPMRSRPPRSSSRCSGSRRSAAPGHWPRSSSSRRRRARRLHATTVARRGRADDAGRLPLPRPQRDGAVRRQGPRPAREAPLVLLGRSPAPVGGGRARRARAGRVARARLGARGSARGASPHPRAPAAGERPGGAAGSSLVPRTARRPVGRHRDADPLRADPEQAPRAARGARARRLRRRRPRRARCRRSARG